MDNSRNHYKSPQESELLDIFPEAYQLAEKCYRLSARELKELEEQCQTVLSATYLEIHKDWNKREPQQFYGRDFEIKLATMLFFDLPTKSLRARTTRLERLAKIVKWRKANVFSSGDIGPADIVEAKAVKITTLISKEDRGGKVGFFLCPFHDEKTPSCKIYSDNHWHCFGCQRRGDSIDLVMHLQKVDFIRAVKMLCGK